MVTLHEDSGTTASMPCIRRTGAILLASALMTATPALASYGQMRLDGAALILAFGFAVTCAFFIDVALFARLFGSRWFAIVATLIAIAVAALLLLQIASPSEREGFFKGAPGGAALVILAATTMVILPFMVGAPLAQYASLRESRRWPRWVGAGLVVQAALVPAFLALAAADEHFGNREIAAGQAAGREARAGALGTLVERADAQRERIWGTPWPTPWRQHPTTAYIPPYSPWMHGLAEGLDGSALVTGPSPLAADDLAALQTLLSRHFSTYAVPQLRARLLWESLRPGALSAQLPATGPSAVSEEVVPPLLERLERYGHPTLCAEGGMRENDRAALTTLVLERGRVWSTGKREYEMRPEWVEFPQRVERVCRRGG